MATLKALAKSVKATVTYGAPYRSDAPYSHGYTVTLHYQRRRMTTPYYMGPAHTEEPTALDVLESVLSDASGYDNARDFEDWCSEYGYDTDSRTAERIYKDVERETKRVKRLLGDDYETFLYADRD